MSDAEFKDSELDWLTPLKDLSKHVWHGRVWLKGDAADEVLPLLKLREGVADVVLWHDWLENSNTYELSLTSTTRAGIVENLEIARLSDPDARMYTCYKRSGEIITFMDWQTFTK